MLPGPSGPLIMNCESRLCRHQTIQGFSRHADSIGPIWSHISDGLHSLYQVALLRFFPFNRFYLLMIPENSSKLFP